MTTNPMFAQARRQPLTALADALALLEAKPKLDQAERLTRAVLMEVICEKSPDASAAFDAWAEDDDAPPDGAVPAILAAVTARQTEDHPVDPVADARDSFADVLARYRRERRAQRPPGGAR